MVLYKLKGVTKQEVRELLEGRSDHYNYVTTIKEDSYFIHSQFDPDRHYRGQVEVFDIGETILCELLFEEERWWKRKNRRYIEILIFSIVSSILSTVFLVLHMKDYDYAYYIVGILTSVVSAISILYCIYLSSRNPYNATMAKRRIQQAFEEWFDDYL